MFKNLREIEEIDFSHNLITTTNFKPEIFEGLYSADSYEPLKNLKILVLTNNSLHSLHPDIFEHTPNLEVLNLSFNVFQTIAQLLANAFGSVLHLRELDLSHMELESIPDTLLINNLDLKVLKLDANLFTTIPKALRFVKNLEQLGLNSNPFQFINATW